MTHTIQQASYQRTTPTALYEANYRRLMRMLPALQKFPVHKSCTLMSSTVLVKILEQYKYTSIISISYFLQYEPLATVNPMAISDLSSIDMDLRVCHDARLLEVIAYQGQSPIHSSNDYPNKHMLCNDEKKQLNLLLKDILESALKAGLNRKCVDSSCN